MGQMEVCEMLPSRPLYTSYVGQRREDKSPQLRFVTLTQAAVKLGPEAESSLGLR